jgi:hypothetical protein
LQATKTAKHKWEEAFKESEIDRQNLAREIELHRSVVHQLRTENEELKEAKPILPTALELLNQVLKQRKSSKIREADIEIILGILGGDNEAS